MTLIWLPTSSLALSLSSLSILLFPLTSALITLMTAMSCVVSPTHLALSSVSLPPQETSMRHSLLEWKSLFGLKWKCFYWDRKSELFKLKHISHRLHTFWNRMRVRMSHLWVNVTIQTLIYPLTRHQNFIIWLPTRLSQRINLGILMNITITMWLEILAVLLSRFDFIFSYLYLLLTFSFSQRFFFRLLWGILT